MADAFSILVLVVGLAGIGVVLWAIRSGATDRHGEDDARMFLELNGHWPDETPAQAAARARIGAADAITEVRPDADGRV